MLRAYRQWFLYGLLLQGDGSFSNRDRPSHLCLGASHDSIGGLSTGKHIYSRRMTALPLHALPDGDLALKSGKTNGPSSHSLDLFGDHVGTDSLPFSHDSG